MIYFQSQVNQLLAAKDSEIASLKAEKERLEKALDYEKKRADLAVDRLLSEKQIPSIHPANPVVNGKEVAAKEMEEALAVVAGIGGDFSSEDKEAI